MVAIRLVESNRGKQFLETTKRYDVIFRGEVFCQLYFNMRGYVGYLPCPPDEGETTPGNLLIGEKGISEYRREIARLNREWAKT